jgi:hypothetical protein
MVTKVCVPKTEILDEAAYFVDGPQQQKIGRGEGMDT